MSSSSLRLRGSTPERAALSLVESRLPTDGFLLTQFETFYQQVVDLKSHVTGKAHGDASTQPSAVREQLLAFLRQEEEQVARRTTLLGSEMYHQAKRVMACMADEIFSTLHWPTGSTWESLEAELFEVSEHRGFDPEGACMQKLSRLLQQDDPAYRELVEVYFYALSLSPKEQQVRERYLQPMLQMLGENGSTAIAKDDHAFAQNYSHTQVESRVALLPSVNPWWWALAIIVFLWLGISWILWSEISSPIDSELQKIQRSVHP